MGGVGSRRSSVSLTLPGRRRGFTIYDQPPDPGPTPSSRLHLDGQTIRNGGSGSATNPRRARVAGVPSTAVSPGLPLLSGWSTHGRYDGVSRRPVGEVVHPGRDEDCTGPTGPGKVDERRSESWGGASRDGCGPEVLQERIQVTGCKGPVDVNSPRLDP